MASITRDTFSEANRLAKVIYQKGRIVQDCELNEMQDNLRVLGARGLGGLIGDAVIGTGIVVSGGTNQVSISAGTVLIGGYPIRFGSTSTVTGLTTPGGSRTDYVYLEVTETEVADPVPSAVLGGTSKRRQITATWKVVENAAVPANSGTNLWEGATLRFEVAKLSRTASAVITSAMILHTSVRPRTPYGDDIDGNRGLFTLVNGRFETTVGDGVTTFGDFNGNSGLTDALGYAEVYLPDNAPVTVAIKPGTYTTTNTINLSGPTRIVGTGVSSLHKAVVLVNNIASDQPTITAGTYQLDVSGVNFTFTSTGYRAISGDSVRVRGCVVAGTLDVASTTDTLLDGWSVEDCTITPVSAKPAFNLSVGGTYEAPRLHVARTRVVMAGASAVFLLNGHGSGTFAGVSARDCHFTVGTGGARTARIGLFSTVDASNPVSVEEMVFRDCVVQTAASGTGSLLRARIGYSSSNDSATTASYIRRTVFEGCRLLQRTSTRNSGGNGPFFRFDIKSFGGAGGTEANNTGDIILRDCTFDCGYLNGEIDSAEAGGTNDKALIWIQATRIYLENCKVQSIKDTLFDTADTAAGIWAHVRLTPVYKEEAPQDGIAAECRVQGLTFDEFLSSGTDDKAYFSLYVDNGTQSRVTVDGMLWRYGGSDVSASFLKNATGACPLSVVGAGEGVIRNCRIFSEYEDRGIVVSGGQKIIEGCYLYGAANYGIDASGFTTAGDGVTIRDCRVDNCKRGIYAGSDNVGKTEVVNCWVANCTTDGIVVIGRHAAVRDCLVEACAGSVATSNMIVFNTDSANDTCVCLGNRCVTSANGSTVAYIQIAVAPAAGRAIGFDTGALGTWTDVTQMSFNDAVLNKP